jgi:DNA-binding Lrp family transcriptional regulator
MSTDPLLELLRSKARLSNEELAELLSLSEKSVCEKIAAWENEGVILGYHAVVNGERAGEMTVRAFIAVTVRSGQGRPSGRLPPAPSPSSTV